MSERAQRRVADEADLRRAIEGGQLVLHYHPQIEVDSGRVRGVEALVRWNHPTRGLIAPDQFIALAEDTGVIVGLGRWVIQQACTDFARWRATGCVSGILSVNVSLRQLHEPSFVTGIMDTIQRTGICPQDVEIEITESIFAKDTSHVIAILSQIRDCGLRVALDDFGAGYSSLMYLQRLPFDAVKIDRSFLTDVPDHHHSSEIFKAIVLLSRTLGKLSIAEGVETAAQIAFLRHVGCPVAQGFVFSLPLPEGSIPDFMANRENTLVKVA
jgi:EAL domain-containing protein (putative c-di-GMP-specific phosphodiesterase class I)